VLVVAPLVAIFVYLVYKGASSLNLAFFTEIPKPVGEWAAAWPTPLSARDSAGVASLIWAFGSASAAASFWPSSGAAKLANAVRFTADVLNGVPSIVMGIAIYSLIVVPQGISRLSRAAWRWAS
jgi:phosphate transport system permease protein